MKSCLVICLLTLGMLQLSAQSTLNRPFDPVVLTGSDLGIFVGEQPGDVVGFSFQSGTWQQIPIQVDERVLLDIVAPYGALANQAAYAPSPSNPEVLFYADPNTFTGADTDPLVDLNDELVFMVKDAGGQTDGSLPTGVLPNVCQEIEITDPLGGSGFVYLYLNDGSLSQDAGVSYLNYSSDVMSTSGFPAHTGGYNAENTIISTSEYSWHFSAEWVSDELVLNGTDLLDRHKNFFTPNTCIRHGGYFFQWGKCIYCPKGRARQSNSFLHGSQ